MFLVAKFEYLVVERGILAQKYHFLAHITAEMRASPLTCMGVQYVHILCLAPLYGRADSLIQLLMYKNHPEYFNMQDYFFSPCVQNMLTYSYSTTLHSQWIHNNFSFEP